MMGDYYTSLPRKTRVHFNTVCLSVFLTFINLVDNGTYMYSSFYERTYLKVFSSLVRHALYFIIKKC